MVRLGELEPREILFFRGQLAAPIFGDLLVLGSKQQLRYPAKAGLAPRRIGVQTFLRSLFHDRDGRIHPQVHSTSTLPRDPSKERPSRQLCAASVATPCSWRAPS